MLSKEVGPNAGYVTGEVAMASHKQKQSCIDNIAGKVPFKESKMVGRDFGSHIKGRQGQ